MSDQNLMMTESIVELSKLINLMDEDAENLSPAQAISDYISPILGSMLAEIEANRQYVLQTADRANLAMMMTEKSFLGEILTNIAEHFSTIVSELPSDTDPNSSLAVAVTEIQDLLATWMSFDSEDEDYSEDEEEDDSEDESEDESEDGEESVSEDSEASDIVDAQDVEVITDGES